MGHSLAGIDLGPEIINLAGFFEVAGSEVIVVGFDVELFPFTDAAAKLVGSSGVFRGEIFFAEVAIGGAEDAIGHGKFRINLDGMLKELYGGGVVGLGLQGFSPEAVGLERFERGCGGLFD